MERRSLFFRMFKKFKYLNQNAWNQHQMSWKTCYCYLSWGQRFWSKPIILPEFKIYVHGLHVSPLPMQNHFSKFIIWRKSFIWYPVSKGFAAHCTTNVWLNIGGENILSYLKSIRKNAFSGQLQHTCFVFNPHFPNGFSHHYHLDESNFNFKGIRSIFSFLFQFL